MDPVALARLAEMRAPLDRLTPVTDAMLRNPSPGDWLHVAAHLRRLGSQPAHRRSIATP